MFIKKLLPIVLASGLLLASWPGVPASADTTSPSQVSTAAATGSSASAGANSAGSTVKVGMQAICVYNAACTQVAITTSVPVSQNSATKVYYLDLGQLNGPSAFQLPPTYSFPNPNPLYLPPLTNTAPVTSASGTSALSGSTPASTQTTATQPSTTTGTAAPVATTAASSSSGSTTQTGTAASTATTAGSATTSQANSSQATVDAAEAVATAVVDAFDGYITEYVAASTNAINSSATMSQAAQLALAKTLTNGGSTATIPILVSNSSPANNPQSYALSNTASSNNGVNTFNILVQAQLMREYSIGHTGVNVSDMGTLINKVPGTGQLINTVAGMIRAAGILPASNPGAASIAITPSVIDQAFGYVKSTIQTDLAIPSSSSISPLDVLMLSEIYQDYLGSVPATTTLINKWQSLAQLVINSNAGSANNQMFDFLFALTADTTGLENQSTGGSTATASVTPGTTVASQAAAAQTQQTASTAATQTGSGATSTAPSTPGTSTASSTPAATAAASSTSGTATQTGNGSASTAATAGSTTTTQANQVQVTEDVAYIIANAVVNAVDGYATDYVTAAANASNACAATSGAVQSAVTNLITNGGSTVPIPVFVANTTTTQGATTAYVVSRVIPVTTSSNINQALGLAIKGQLMRQYSIMKVGYNVFDVGKAISKMPGSNQLVNEVASMIRQNDILPAANPQAINIEVPSSVVDQAFDYLKSVVQSHLGVSELVMDGSDLASAGAGPLDAVMLSQMFQNYQNNSSSNIVTLVESLPSVVQAAAKNPMIPFFVALTADMTGLPNESTTAAGNTTAVTSSAGAGLAASAQNASGAAGGATSTAASVAVSAAQAAVQAAQTAANQIAAAQQAAQAAAAQAASAAVGAVGSAASVAASAASSVAQAAAAQVVQAAQTAANQIAAAQQAAQAAASAAVGSAASVAASAAQAAAAQAAQVAQAAQAAASQAAQAAASAANSLIQAGSSLANNLL